MSRLGTLVIGAALAFAPVGSAGATGAATAAAPPRPSCHGKPATLVGRPGHTVMGTRHADVIVTNGGSVKAGPGDDLICVTGIDYQDPAHVDAGKGNDRVDASHGSAQVYLGPGTDSYLGSGRSDQVDATGGGKDSVFTLGGRDEVSAGGLKGHHDHDLVRLGPGDDLMQGTADVSTRWYGDAGTDLVDMLYGDGHDFFYDAAHGRASKDGKVVQQFIGFERFEFPYDYPYPSARSFRFLGGPGPETLYLELYANHAQVDMGGGDDVVQLWTREDQRRPAGTYYAIDGGPGHDTFQPLGGCGLDCTEDFSAFVGVDLAAHTISLARCRTYFSGCDYRDDKARRVGTVSGVEDVRPLYYDDVDLVGDSADNLLESSTSCRGTFEGGAGDDRLAAGIDGYDTGCDFDDDQTNDPGAMMHGDGGDDTLVGGFGNDTLVGGADTDSADGGHGTDTCDAEVTKSCE